MKLIFSLTFGSFSLLSKEKSEVELIPFRTRNDFANCKNSLTLILVLGVLNLALLLRLRCLRL